MAAAPLQWISVEAFKQPQGETAGTAPPSTTWKCAPRSEGELARWRDPSGRTPC